MGATPATIAIQVNGEPRTLDEGATILTLLESLGLAGRLVAVLRNGEVVVRARHAETRLAPGDVLEIVHMVGGG